jgi:Ni/Co efflux regulator RcnB
MNTLLSATSKFSGYILASCLVVSSAMAQPQDRPKPNNAKGAQKQSAAEVKVERSSNSYRFTDNQRIEIRNYYVEEIRQGHCPPGLAKKNNGCQPPGQARKWVIGQPLPRDVIFYNVSPRISIQLGIPPAGHRFVRVATDILLIAIGTGMVIDAIEDLGKM